MEEYFRGIHQMSKEDRDKIHGLEVMLRACQKLGIQSAVDHMQLVKRIEARIKIHKGIKDDLKEMKPTDGGQGIFKACQADMANELEELLEPKK